MLIGGYPITNIKCRASSLADYGYKVWYWQLEGSAYDCPLEPLTQEFWQAMQKSQGPKRTPPPRRKAAAKVAEDDGADEDGE